MLRVLLALVAELLVTVTSAAQQVEWPRTVDVPQGCILLWMPQVDEWRDGQLIGRSAGALRDANGNEINFALTFRAATDLDRTRRRVRLGEIALPALSVAREATAASDYPTTGDLDSLRETVTEAVPELLDSISLDEVLAVIPDSVFSGAPEPTNPDEVRQQLTSDRQARMGDWLRAREAWLIDRELSLVRIPRAARLSLQLDGAAQLVACESAQVEVVSNCALPLLKTNDRFYCCTGGAWWEGTDPLTPLTPCESLPVVLLNLPDEKGLAPLSAIRPVKSTQSEVCFAWDARAFPALARQAPQPPAASQCAAPPGLPPWFPLRSGEPAHQLTAPEILFLSSAEPHQWAVAALEGDRFVGRDGRVWKMQGQRWKREDRAGGWEAMGPLLHDSGFSPRTDLPAARYEFEVTQDRSDPIVWRLERERFRRSEAAERRARWIRFLECTASALSGPPAPLP